MHTTRLAMAIGGALFLATSVAGAQGRGRGNNGVPPGQMPSAGMCRVWIDGVPPGQQAPQTDCDTARRTVPANGRILYGPSVGTTTASQGDPRRGAGNGQSGNVDPRRSGTYGQGVGAGDPRRSGNGRYDGHYDGRNRSEDRDDDHDRNGHHDSRYDNRAAERARIAREQERQARLERERQRVEQARIERERKVAWERERAAQRERERLAREERRRDRERQRQQPAQSSARVYPEQQPASRPVRTVFGTVQTATPAGCVDANRDGVCDSTDPRKH